MVTKEGILVQSCTGEVLFGECPENYTGLSGVLWRENGEFFLRTYRNGEEISPTAESLACAGKMLWDQGVRECPVLVKSPKNDGKYRLLCSTCNQQVTGVTFNVGNADFIPKNIPIRFEKSIINDKISLPEQRPFRMTALGFSDPYAVIFVDTVGDCTLLDQGAKIRAMQVFPQGAEVLFVYVRGERELHLRVCHRDGSDAVRGNDVCAALAAAVATGRCLPDTAVTVPLAKGDLRAVCTKEWELFLTMPILS